MELKMKVRFIVQVIRTWNRNGYFYRCATVTATKTGKSLFFASVGGDENVQSMLGRVTGDRCYPAIFSTTQDVGAREFNRLVKSHEGRHNYEGNINRDLIESLETEGGE
jgi:hypothetical protein